MYIHGCICEILTGGVRVWNAHRPDMERYSMPVGAGGVAARIPSKICSSHNRVYSSIIICEQQVTKIITSIYTHEM